MDKPLFFHGDVEKLSWEKFNCVPGEKYRHADKNNCLCGSYFRSMFINIYNKLIIKIISVLSGWFSTGLSDMRSKPV